MRKQLSSNFTFFRKLGPAIFWLWLLYMFFSNYEFSFETWSLMLLFFCLLLVAAVGFIAFDNFRLKDVSIDNEALYASTIFKEVKIPFDAIEEVKLRRRSKRELMVVHVKLRSRCDFGREILFEPIWGWSQPEPWEDLEDLISK